VRTLKTSLNLFETLLQQHESPKGTASRLSQHSLDFPKCDESSVRIADDPNTKGRKVVGEAKKVISAYYVRFFETS
jgi:hypothetical protein